MFSTSSAKTLPFASQERQLGGSVGRTRITGPEMSDATSALTQESSSSAASFVGADVVVRPFDVGAESASSSAATRFLFLGFLSPLNTNAFTIVWLQCYGVRRNFEDQWRTWSPEGFDRVVRVLSTI